LGSSSRLDVHERGGHYEELAGDIEVQFAQQVHVSDELGGQLREVDLMNVHAGQRPARSRHWLPARPPGVLTLDALGLHCARHGVRLHGV
jgi:hypothetical protein